MKKIILAALGLFAGLYVQAQQRPHYTQYMINNYLVNPAISGTEEYVDIKAGFRTQWTQFDGAPKTFYVSGHGPIGRHFATNTRTKHTTNGFHGAGGIITKDITGPTSRLSAYATYSYHLKLSKEVFLSMAAQGGFQQYYLNGGMLDLENPNDPAAVTNKVIVPDVSLGTWLYSKNFYAGASMTQLIPSKIKFSDNFQPKEAGKLKQHYFIMAGYRYKVNREVAFIPSFAVKVNYPAPVSFDINCKIRYMDKVFGGISYRHKDAVALIAGVTIREMFDVSYSYDFTTSDIRKYSAGSHEVVVGYRLSLTPGLHCPAHFW